MLDRFGRKVSMGWSEAHLLYVIAAETLHGKARFAAYRDISALTGRTYSAVKTMAARKRREGAHLALLTAQKPSEPRQPVIIPRQQYPRPTNAYRRRRFPLAL